MKVIDRGSKKGKYFLDCFEKSSCGGILPYLSQVYGSYSQAKINAYNDCREYAFEYVKRLNKFAKIGECWKVADIGVISYNSQMFTFGAILHKCDVIGRYLESVYLVITKDNIYLI